MGGGRNKALFSMGKEFSAGATSAASAATNAATSAASALRSGARGAMAPTAHFKQTKPMSTTDKDQRESNRA